VHVTTVPYQSVHRSTNQFHTISADINTSIDGITSFPTQKHHLLVT